jgi:hypothetical protein
MRVRPIVTISFGLALIVGGAGLAAAQGASDYAPPHSYRNKPPGQGGKAPGQILNDRRDRETVGSGRGASKYAPPHSRRNDPPGLGGKPPGQIKKDKK